MKRLIFTIVLLVAACVSIQAQSVSSSLVRRLAPATFANLGSPPNGSVRYCTNCQATAPCTSGGTGAVASRVNGAWNCSSGGSGTGDVVGPASATNEHLAVFDGPTGKLIKDGGVVPTVPVKASGAEINTGTDDAKFVTAKAIEDSNLARTSDIPAAGPTINPTNGVIPYRSSASAFGDSQLSRADADIINFTAATPTLNLVASGGNPALGFNAPSGSDMLLYSNGTNWSVYNGTDRFKVNIADGTATFSGHAVFSADNTNDIGASGATRPRTGYFGTSLVVGGNSSVITQGAHNGLNGLKINYSGSETFFISQNDFGTVTSNTVALAGGALSSNNSDVGLTRHASNVARISDGITGAGWGKLLSGRVVTAKTGDYVVTSNEVATFFTNTGAGAAVVFTLPTPVVGMAYEFYRDANQTLTVDVAAGITIRAGASVSTSGGSVTLDAVGSRIRLVAISTTQWVGDVTGAATFN